MATTTADIQGTMTKQKKGPPLPAGWIYGQTSARQKFPGNTFNQYYTFPATEKPRK